MLAYSFHSNTLLRLSHFGGCLPHLSKISRRKKSNLLIHATYERNKWDDDHIPTCMFENKTNVFSLICLPPYYTWKFSANIT